MTGARGMLGNVVVYRQFRGQTLLCNRPEKRNTITPHQQRMKTRFLAAVAFAKKQIADPVTKALYQPGPESKFTSAYAAALADYLKRPVIDDVDVSNYKGNEGDAIVVKASDVVQNLNVMVTLLDTNSILIEQGEAISTLFTKGYVFKTNKRHEITGCTILITVRDRPGNVVYRELKV